MSSVNINEMPVEQEIIAAYQAELDAVASNPDAFNEVEIAVNFFESTFSQGIGKNPFVDVGLVCRLYIQSKALLEICRVQPDSNFYPYVLAAIRYFVNEDDGKSDYEEEDGFVDDEQVLQWAITKFDLTDSMNREIEKLRSQSKAA